MKTDVMVIGGGLSGLCAALGSQKAGMQTTLVSTGVGVLYLSSGCIDLMAYPEGNEEQAVESPLDAIAKLVAVHPEHPYAKTDMETLCKTLDGFVAACRSQQVDIFGDGSKNWWIPTGLGTVRPTAIVPSTMVMGDVTDKRPMVLVGFSGHRDFFPELAAREISRAFSIETERIFFDPVPHMDGGTVNTVNLGRAFEDPKFCEAFVRFLNRNTTLEHRVGIPAVLGVDGARLAHRTLEQLTGRQIFEIPILPPSLPGRRISQALKREFFELGGQMVNGCPVLGAETTKGRVDAIVYKAGGHRKTVPVRAVVLASGGFFSGGLIAGRQGIREPIFDLPVVFEPEITERFNKDFLGPGGHPVAKAGVRVDGDYRPSTGDGAIYENLFACGDLIGGFDSLTQRSGGGVAICSGTLAGQKAAVLVAEKGGRG